jgi:hypothetical protein
MPTRKLMVAIVLTVGAVVAARARGLWVGEQLSPRKPTPDAPALVFATDDLTFGPIPEGESIERELRLTNTSKVPVAVERWERSCSCLGIEPAGNFTVPPGETTVLRVMLNASIPANGKLSDDGLYREQVNLDAVAVAPPGVAAPRFSAVVRFTVRPTLRFDPPGVKFGVVSHREPLVVKTTVTLLPPITEIRVVPHPEWDVTVTTKGDTQREIVATPKKPGEPRVVNDALQLQPIGSDGKARPSRPLLLKGEVRSDIVSSPADIPLGRVKVGVTVDESFRVLSLTGRKFEVVSLSAEPHELIVRRDTADETLFLVRAAVTERGQKQCIVTVIAKQDDGQLHTLRVPVCYSGE